MSDNFDYAVIQDYLASLVPARPDEMLAMEKYADENGFPIIGPAAGYACYQIARMIGAKNIFEMGSGYGYSTAWFAKAVDENGGGIVHHVVWDEQLSRMAQRHLLALGYENIVKYTVGEAVATLRKTPGQFDLIFNDIDKEAYPESLALIKQKLYSGGVLITDNLLWHARIFDPADRDTSTEAIRLFTKQITSDPDFVTTILPIRDGVLVAFKK